MTIRVVFDENRNQISRVPTCHLCGSIAIASDCGCFWKEEGGGTSGATKMVRNLRSQRHRKEDIPRARKLDIDNAHIFGSTVHEIAIFLRVAGVRDDLGPCDT